MTTLIIGDIQRDRDLQPRVMMNEQVVAEYAEQMEAGDVFPPVDVFSDGESYWLADGFHRVAAAELAQRRTIEAEVRPGTKRDAILWGVQANRAHGIRRSIQDKRRAVSRLLHDLEWGKWSDREIARVCEVSPTFVGKVRSEVSVNVDSERTYMTRHGTVATIETAQIAAAAKARTKPMHAPSEHEAAVWEIEAAIRKYLGSVFGYPGEERRDTQACIDDLEQMLSERNTERLVAYRPTGEIWMQDLFSQALANTLKQLKAGLRLADVPEAQHPKSERTELEIAEYRDLERAVYDYLGPPNAGDTNLKDRIAKLDALMADEFSEAFAEFELYIGKPYRREELQRCFVNARHMLGDKLRHYEYVRAREREPSALAPDLAPRTQPVCDDIQDDVELTVRIRGAREPEQRRVSIDVKMFKHGRQKADRIFGYPTVRLPVLYAEIHRVLSYVLSSDPEAMAVVDRSMAEAKGT